MDGFLNWFYAFMTTMLGGLWQAISNLFLGLVQVFNLPAYFSQINSYKDSFTVIDWILSIFAFIFVFAIWAIIIAIIVLLLRKYIRFRRTVVGNEDLLEELADLHRDVTRLTKEKEKILALQVGQSNITLDQLQEIFDSDKVQSLKNPEDEESESTPSAASADKPSGDGKKVDTTPVSGVRRFFRLSGTDDKYEFYIPPEYDTTLTLAGICEDYRNFACSHMHLYYELRTIRLMFAGLASTKLILLQGISGTGKTSLPYSLGKYFLNDATIASVQPSWRDRSELFGFYNEFTKKFNETEFLKRMYEASYNDDINIIVLDEMNIARVEYYFAEMLSILEMPDPNEWKIELVNSVWPDDPRHLKDGKLSIPQNVWYIGTANNDDSTFAISDKVYDRALVINLDSKGVPFDAPDTPERKISFSYVDSLYKKALSELSVRKEYLDNIAKLDLYVIQKFRVAFGNRIMKQLKVFVPVYIAAGGEEVDAIDYLLATKVFRKFEALNLSLIRDEIDGLVAYLNNLFGNGAMRECITYLERLKRTY